MKNWYPILMICLAAVLLIVEQPLLALIFGGIGIVFLTPLGQPKSAPKKSAGAVSASKAPQKNQISSPSGKSASQVKKSTREKKSSPVRGVPHSQRYAPVPGAPAVDAYAYSGSQEEYFHRLLTGTFSGYTIRRNMPVNQLAKSPDGPWVCSCGASNSTNFCGECGNPRPAAPAPIGTVPVTFLICQDGQPRLAVLLGGPKDKQKAPWQKTLMRLEQQGIPTQYYINTFRNKASYVVNRIRSELR